MGEINKSTGYGIWSSSINKDPDKMEKLIRSEDYFSEYLSKILNEHPDAKSRKLTDEELENIMDGMDSDGEILEEWIRDKIREKTGLASIHVLMDDSGDSAIALTPSYPIIGFSEAIDKPIYRDDFDDAVVEVLNELGDNDGLRCEMLTAEEWDD